MRLSLLIFYFMIFFMQHRSVDLVASKNDLHMFQLLKEWSFRFTFSHPENSFELRNRFYKTEWDTAVCVLVVFSCTVDTEVYTCVLLVCNSWEFKEIGL